MSLCALANFLALEPQYQTLCADLHRKEANTRVLVSNSSLAFTLAGLAQSLDMPILVITDRPDNALGIYHQVGMWGKTDSLVMHFPENESLPFERLASDVDTVHQRLEVLSALSKVGISQPLVISSITAILQKTIAKDSLTSIQHTLHHGDKIKLQEVLSRWSQIGYQFESNVYIPGYASLRGGIVDVFPVGSKEPVRIELWGDEIISMRFFDPETQRSTGAVHSISLCPALETLPRLIQPDEVKSSINSLDFTNCTTMSQQRMVEELNLLIDGYEVDDVQFYSGFFNDGSLFDYFPDNALLVLHNPVKIHSALKEAGKRVNNLREAKENRGALPNNFPSPYHEFELVEKRLGETRRRLEIFTDKDGALDEGDLYILPFGSTPSFFGKLDSFIEDVSDFLETGHRVIALSSHTRRLREILSSSGISSVISNSLTSLPDEGVVALVGLEDAPLADGFTLTVHGQRVVIFSDVEIFGMTKQRRPRPRIGRKRSHFLSELCLGDYVVHIEHGVGRFQGTGRLSDDEGGEEYLILLYAHQDKLYVPVTHLDRVTPYVAPLGHPPTLTRLGTSEWRRAKARASRSTREMASELLTIYAARELVDGHIMAPDSLWQEELEESFPFEETSDQIATISEVKTDMESSKPMDRLVCGDVGYGKTEIALRAAFKAVMDGKQVAVLVPTTVLAQQHYVTFSERLAPFPTSVEVLSRFRTNKEQAGIVAGLESGRVDICIGTHRMLQKDIRFKNLGLIIVDEEQRFGVAHKEGLKQQYEGVDVLTLTATPIPRTLHMSLAGVRDLSTMDTPPEERLPIKTFVSEFSDELVREAILRELDRQGQIFFLHNKVQSIDNMAHYIETLVPEVQIGIAHGQMPENELEKVMMSFSSGAVNVLVCTTIIESGLDIPNANTLIINRADAFGLAQLYQLRGRVGRSARRAYTYLLVPKSRSLTETAERRLKAMLAATELGAGFHIAMKDLEIRGAGNILGAEQSGHINAIGFNLYSRLLSLAVEDLRADRLVGQSLSIRDHEDKKSVETAPYGIQEPGDGSSEPLTVPELPVVQLGIPASITEEYITDMATRLEIYNRLASQRELAGIDDIAEELLDRFGPAPIQVENLMFMIKSRIHASQAALKSIVRSGDEIVLQLKTEVGGAKEPLSKFLGQGIRVGNTQIRIDITENRDDWRHTLEMALGKLITFHDKVMDLPLSPDVT